ncbi:MAG: family 10 glycosylhydrolase [Candidatus Sumerlaeia bacterium]|nr:family 10 glycosylhydrolase [Candidatus Sumerlaeia bacterium]
MLRSLTLVLAACLILSCARAGGRTDAGPAPRERGVWLSKNEMLLPRAELERLLDGFAEARLNVVYVNAQLRGFLMYPGSKHVPQWPEMAAHDPRIMDWLIPAIHARGMRAEAWMEYGFYAYWTPDATKDSSRGPILDKHPELVAIDSDGNQYLHNRNWGDFYSLCPSNPKSHAILIDLMDEVLALHNFDGINLDRIRWTSEHFCYNDHCKARFREHAGMDLVPFDNGTPEWETWNAWRKEQLNAFMRALSTRIRTNHPGKSLTAAVMPPYMIDEKAQDWPTWLREGTLDRAMPMMYVPDLTRETASLRRIVPASDLSRVVYGINTEQREEIVLRQLGQLAAMDDIAGFAIWFSGSVAPMLPAIAALPDTTFVETPVAPGDEQTPDRALFE